MLAVKISQRISDYVQQIVRASVKIEVAKADGTGEIGAGFFVSPNIIVSCAHVVGFTQENPNPQIVQIIATTEDNAKLQARVLDYDSHLDISVLQVDTTSSNVKTFFLNLGNSGTIKEGEIVVTLGSPLGYTNSASYGIVSKRYANNNNYFLLDMRTNPGNSGGLIYSVDKQAVIGVCVAVYNSSDMTSEGISVGIAIDAIKNLLKKNGVKFTYHEKQH
jgi:serine protease Do